MVFKMDKHAKGENQTKNMMYTGISLPSTSFQLSGVIKSRVSSKPGEVICSVAEEDKATMIVMGTRGLGKVRRTIMGSVSDYVVHHAHCPVIVCRK